MAALPTNYVDDQLASSMGGRRHYNMTTDAYGTYFTDVTQYTQRGSIFGALQINEITRKINSLDYKISATVSGSSVSFTDNSLTSTSVIDGVYVTDVIVFVAGCSYNSSTHTVTYTFKDSSANGKTAYIWVRNIS